MLSTLFEKLVDLFLISFQNKKILKYLPKDLNLIIDVGAHEGQLYKSIKKYNINFNKLILFEPYEVSYNEISKINDERVITYNVALGSKKELRNFNINKYNVTNTFSEPNEKSINNKIKNFIFSSNSESSYYLKKEYVINTLDFYLRDFTEDVDLLKIDTEGFELEVLKGVEDTLKKGKVKNIVLEKHKKGTYANYDPERIDKFLSSHNYRLVKNFNVLIFGFKDCLYTKII